jgi:hypothetical protein
MGRRLILDTNILIAYKRGTIDKSFLDEDELAIATVTMAEYRLGKRHHYRCSTTPPPPRLRTLGDCSPPSAGLARPAARTT